MAFKQRVGIGLGTTWTVLGVDYRVVEPAEQFLEYLRATARSPNTVKAYAKALELWWTFLERRGQQWDRVGVTDVATFMDQLRRGAVEADRVPTVGSRLAAASTVALRVRAVMSFYQYHAACGVRVAEKLYATARSHPGRYLPFLEHIARTNGRRSSVVPVRARAAAWMPVLTPAQMSAVRDAEATWDEDGGVWRGELRYRLLWALLEETGLRLGEALGLQHRDWKVGTGATAQVEVIARDDHPHGVRAKSGDRRIFVGSRLDGLYGDYVWQLCESGADVAVNDWDRAYIFCNLRRGEFLAPLRPESVYKHLRSIKGRLPALPAAMTPHWYRHTHATALLLAGTPVHVVSRRLGHADVQTTLNTYGHVTEDAQLRACADWQRLTRAWGVGHDG